MRDVPDDRELERENAKARKKASRYLASKGGGRERVAVTVYSLLYVQSDEPKSDAKNTPRRLHGQRSAGLSSPSAADMMLSIVGRAARLRVNTIVKICMRYMYV